LNNQEKGYLAEQKALAFLESKGYTLVRQNYRHKKGEIDLIVRKNKLLVFVEVRFRSSTEFGFPEQTISEKKKKLLLQTAEQFIIENNWQDNIRFDIIALSDDDLQHFEDAFF
jgi:putative endonuclease